LTQPEIIVIGNVVADIVARTVDDVPRHSSLHPESVSFHPGGCAGNAALALARLDVSARLLACVGQDAMGRALVEEWKAGGVDTSRVQQVPGANTGMSIVLVDSDGQRRFIASPAANRYLTPAALTAEVLEGAFAVHVGGFFAAPGLEDGSLPARLAEARARGILTTLDPVGGAARERRENLFAVLPHIDLLQVNEDEAMKLSGETTQEAMLEGLLERGARTVVLKLGAAGCRVAGERGPLDIPGYPATPVDTTGAGDAFAGALLAALARGDALDEALRWANAAGAATVESTGATGSWQGWKDLERVRARASHS
jgi:ribokinase